MSPTNRNPWDSDLTLETEDVRAIVSRVRPDLAPFAVERLGEGWDFWAYLVNRRHVARFPKRAREQARLRREHALLPIIERRLAIPVPRYDGALHSDEAFPFVFGFYDLLDGVQAYLKQPGDVDLDALGTSFGRELRKLHAVPREDVEAVCADVPGRGRSLPELRDRAPSYFHHLEQPLRERMEAFFDAGRALPDAFAGPDVLVHSDPHAEHLMLDRKPPHALAGIIDWGDLSFGDPAMDVSAPYPWGGEHLLAATLAAYASDDDGLPARARFVGAFMTLVELDYATHFDRRDYVDVLCDVLRRVPSV